MAKKLINLLIESDSESKSLRRLKKITPFTSIGLIILYLVLYSVSLVYVRVNLNDYNKIKSQVEAYERKITASKSSESIYITTIGVLDKIKTILARDSEIIDDTLPVIFEYQSDSVIVDSISVDNTGPVSFQVKASSIDVMTEFVNKLKESEEEYAFKNVKATGILRENDGSYTFTVNLNVEPQKNNDK